MASDMRAMDGGWVAEDDIVIQFGKVGDNSYTLDFAHPISAFQAFAIGLTAFEG
jgi:tubby-related protein 1